MSARTAAALTLRLFSENDTCRHIRTRRIKDTNILLSRSLFFHVQTVNTSFITIEFGYRPRADRQLFFEPVPIVYLYSNIMKSIFFLPATVLALSAVAGASSLQVPTIVGTAVASSGSASASYGNNSAFATGTVSGTSKPTNTISPPIDNGAMMSSPAFGGVTLALIVAVGASML